MMIWNASGLPVWQVAFVWAGVILFWGFVIWAGYTHTTLTVIPHTARLGAALVYLAALPVASLLPVPGGRASWAFSWWAGEFLDGASIVPAIVAVLLFRLITYWLIIVPGFFAYRRLTREQDLETA
jgi:uncharacterized membrane protein YbhN (UPF0104 family)